MFGLSGIVSGLFGGLGNPGQEQTDLARMAAAQRRQAIYANARRHQQSGASEQDYVDVAFTVLDDQPALEHTKLLEDKR